MSALDRDRLRAALGAEEERFAATHRGSRELYEAAKGSLLAGVPMPWMTEWAGPHPVFAAAAEGARFTDVDGNDYVDFCLGDTGAMTGHAPRPTVEAIAEQAGRGITLMLPTEDSAWVGQELRHRFGLPYWQFALTATDANRWAIRLARLATGRPKILVFSFYYHGSVDEIFAVPGPDGRAVARARAGEGPSLLECKTYRFRGHSRFEPAGYRTKQELEAWKARDPLPAWRGRLAAEWRVREAELASLEGEADREIAAAVAFAESSPDPDPAAYRRFIFKDG